MRVQIVHAQEYRRERWRNGRGWTREIAEASDAGGDPLWRLSVAEIAEDVRFSEFPGIDRHQVLLGGEGFRLAFADGVVKQVMPPHGQLSYPGEGAPDCRLVDGPVQVWNLFARRGAVAFEVLHRPLVGSMLFFPDDAVTWALYLLSGRAEFRDRPELAPLLPGDSALLSSPRNQEPHRLILGGGGELLAARLTRIEGD